MSGDRACLADEFFPDRTGNPRPRRAYGRSGGRFLARFTSLIGCLALLTPVAWAQLQTSYRIDTFAGRRVLEDGGPATQARIARPEGVAVDGAGNLYIADSSNHRIRKVDSTGTITTVAGTGELGFSGDGGAATHATLAAPTGVAVDSTGNFYFTDTGNYRIRKVDSTGTITTVAGTGELGFSGDSGPATQAQIDSPYGVAVDSTGNLYFADARNDRIRKVDSTGTITTVAGGMGSESFRNGDPATRAPLNSPTGVAVDGAGNLYIADRSNHRILKVDSAGTGTTVAGIPRVSGPGGDGGPARQATLSWPRGVAVDGAGNLYIADTGNGLIRKIDSTGTITTVAGGGGLGSGGDGGPATQAQLTAPEAVAVDGAGHLYIADRSSNRVRKVDSTGTITTVAGTGEFGFSGDDSPATQAEINSPYGVAADGAGNLYIADSGNDRIRKVDSTGTITTVAGTGEFGFSGDGGPATQAWVNSPDSVVVDGAGSLYISHRNNNRVRKVDSTGTITTIAGTGERGFGGDGGPASQAQISSPTGVAVDGAGNLYIADSGNQRIRKVDSTGTITTVAGTGEHGFGGDGGPASQAQISSPTGVAVDGAGNLYIADAGNHRVRRVDSTGTITTVAGTGEHGFGGDGGPASQAQISSPTGVAVDGAGNLYIADAGNHRVRRVDSTGTITTVAGTGEAGFGGDGAPATQAGIDRLTGVAVDGAGNLYIADWNSNRVRKVDSTGTITTIAGTGERGFGGDGGPASQAQISSPTGVAVDGAGNLYIADWDNGRIRRVDSAGTITTIAGTGGFYFRGDGGPARQGWLSYPTGVAVDGAGNLYIADADDHRIRKVDSTTGTITTVAGGVNTFGGDGGPASEAQISSPTGIAVDGAGNLYISDRSHRIRKVDSTGTITTVAGTGRRGFSGDGGPASQARLNFPTGVAVDGAGNLYIADRTNFRIRKVDSTGTITTVAGTGRRGFSGDGGPASQAQIELPTSVAIDGAGNLYIADAGNDRIRRVDSTTGTITTVAGTGRRGFSGDGGPASQAQISSPRGVAVDGAGNLYIADAGNDRIRLLSPTGTSATQRFSIPEQGGVSLTSQGASPALVAGYGQVDTDAGMTAPAGLAIFGLRQNGILVSEAGVPAAAAVLEGRIFAETDGALRTGVAMANPNGTAATIAFFFTDSQGIDSGPGTFTLGPREQIAQFLDEDPFNGGTAVGGTFTFSSDLPVAVIALRGLVNERSEFLMTTLPVAPLTAGTADTVYFPHFAAGAGWTTQVILVNPTHAPIQGSVQFLGPGSETANAGPAMLTLADGRDGSTFPYAIPPRSATRFQTASPVGPIQTGSVRVVADLGHAAPSGVSIFSYQNAGVTVSEAGVPASISGNAFRVYAETSGTPGQPGSVRSGIALTNTSETATVVSLELTALDGSATGLTESLTLPASGQVARFSDEFFPTLTTPFSGILRIASPTPDIAVVGLRLTTNQRFDIVVTTTPPAEENAAAHASDLFFPHFVDSGGWTTQFVLFSGTAGQTSSGLIRFTGQNGQPLELAVKPTTPPASP